MPIYGACHVFYWECTLIWRVYCIDICVKFMTCFCKAYLQGGCSDTEHRTPLFLCTLSSCSGISARFEEPTNLKPYLQPSMIKAFPWRCVSLRTFHCHCREIAPMCVATRMWCDTEPPPQRGNSSITQHLPHTSTCESFPSLGHSWHRQLLS